MVSISRLGRLSRAVALIAVILGAGRLVWVLSTVVDAAYATAFIRCTARGCGIDTAPIDLLPGSTPIAIRAMADTPAQIASLIQLPSVHHMIALGTAIESLPLVALYFLLARAFTLFAVDPVGDRAIPWLRLASLAALVTVLVQPVADSLRATALSPLIFGYQHNALIFNGGPFIRGLLLAGAAWISVRLLEQARDVRAELAEIV